MNRTVDTMSLGFVSTSTGPEEQASDPLNGRARWTCERLTLPRRRKSPLQLLSLVVQILGKKQTNSWWLNQLRSLNFCLNSEDGNVSA